MALFPSIYDLRLDPLQSYDFSRPLFVQASPSTGFTEIVDAFHGRLALPADRSAILVTATHPARPWWPGRHIVNPSPRLSARTAGWLGTAAHAHYSVVVVTTSAPIADYYPAMRYHSNVAAFCHAMEPTPVLVVNAVGQFAPARTYFLIAQHAVGPHTFTANMLIGAHEAHALAEAAAKRPAGHAVEVGRFSGGTAVLLALAGRASARPGVVSIDAERLPAAEYFLDVNHVATDVELVDAPSIDAARQWATRGANDISLLFIDADHSYEAVVADLTAWLPFVVDGGTVALHDASTPDCGVGKAVYQHLIGRDGFGHFRQVDSTIFCERVRSLSRCA